MKQLEGYKEINKDIDYYSKKSEFWLKLYIGDKVKFKDNIDRAKHLEGLEGIVIKKRTDYNPRWGYVQLKLEDGRITKDVYLDYLDFVILNK